MMYRGYEITTATESFPGIPPRPVTIIKADLEVRCKDRDVAKYVVDAKIRTGEWKEREKCG